MSPSLAEELSATNGIHLPNSAFGPSGYAFGDFEAFLEVYDQVGRVVQRSADLQRLATDYLVRVAGEGTQYVELMLSPDHSQDNGISLSDQFDAVAAGIEEAHARTGIYAVIIATAVRHRGPDAAAALAERLSTLAHPYVRGFGLTGNEKRFDIREFSGAFYVARLSGLGCTAHVGEWTDAASVLRAVSELNLSRVGHGLSIVEDHRVLQELAERQITFEICLSSNLRLKRCGLSDHPVRKMLEAGCKITFATDDPAYFGTTPSREYGLAEQELGLSPTQFKDVNLNAVDAAFCPDEVKEELRRRLAKDT